MSFVINDEGISYIRSLSGSASASSPDRRRRFVGRDIFYFLTTENSFFGAKAEFPKTLEGSIE